MMDEQKRMTALEWTKMEDNASKALEHLQADLAKGDAQLRAGVTEARDSATAQAKLALNANDVEAKKLLAAKEIDLQSALASQTQAADQGILQPNALVVKIAEVEAARMAAH